MDVDTLKLSTNSAFLAQNIISPPLFGLPVELWGEIFNHSLDDKFIPSLASSPLLITQICREWRNIALSTPSLWVNLVITVADRTPIDSIALWLSRSASLPLSLTLHWLEDTPSTTFFALFASHLYHWKSLFLYLTPETPLLPAIPPEGAPMLECVTISQPPRNRKFIQWLCSAMHAAPRLKHVCGPMNTPLDLPWARLSTLMICVSSLKEALDILAQASKLVKCKFSFLPQAQQESIHRPHILLPQLNDLSTAVYGAGMSYLTPFFDHLTLPTLKTFCGSSPLNHSFLSLLSRSRTCSLSTLELLQVHISESLLLEFLRHHCTQTLSNLTIKWCPGVITDRVLELLTFRDGHECFLTKLETLHFTSSIHSADGLLANMIESRSPSRLLPAGVNSLAKVIIDGLDSVIHENDLSRLRVFQGLRVDLLGRYNAIRLELGNV